MAIGTTVKVGWDAAAVKTGGFLKPREQACDIRGCVVLDGHDPEGNVVQFKQRVGS
jgi:hypothetical protein